MNIRNKKVKTKRDEAGKFTTGNGGLSIMEKINWRRAAPVIAIVSFVGGMLVYQTFASINRPEYRYSARVCTSGRPKQIKNCRDLSAEALVFRLNKATTNQAPSTAEYNEWVRKLLVDEVSPDVFAQSLTEAVGSNTVTNQAFVESLYQNLFGTTNGYTGAISQWVNQLNRGGQTRAQITMYLAKQPSARDNLNDAFYTFYSSMPLVNLSDVTPPAEPEEPADPEVPEEPEEPEEPADPSGPFMEVGFIGVKFTGTNGGALFDQTVEIMESALLSHKPFNEMQNKIRFHKKNSPNYDYGCSGGYDGSTPESRYVTCDDQRGISNAFTIDGGKADKFVVLINDDRYGGAGGNSQGYFNAGVGNSYRTDTLVHEFGHMMGLKDEYLHTEGMQQTYLNNIAQYMGTRQGQCIVTEGSVPSNWRDVQGVWTAWKDVPNVQWYQECSATYWKRPSANSIMRSTGGTFNSVSVEVIRQHINQIVNSKN